jgi:hypothetical protein
LSKLALVANAVPKLRNLRIFLSWRTFWQNGMLRHEGYVLSVVRMDCVGFWAGWANGARGRGGEGLRGEIWENGEIGKIGRNSSEFLTLGRLAGRIEGVESGGGD